MSKQPSRAGKAKPSKDVKGKPNPAEKLLTTLFEIVPGKFNENDWNLMLETDDSQEFIWEIIDEIFDSTIKVIYDKYLQRQTIPYTINEARKAILHIIDWQFLTKDKDDDLTETWVEDEEPEACIIDSWAQGYVQAVISESETKKSKSSISAPEKDENTYFLEELNRIIDQPEYGTERSNANERDAKKQEDSSRAKAVDKKTTNKPKMTQVLFKGKPKSLIEDKQTADKESLLMSREKFEEAPKPRVTVPEIKKLEEPISKAPIACQSILKTLLSRPAAMREIGIDSFGNIESMQKLDLDKMQPTNIKARFTVVNETKTNTVEQKKSKNNLNNSFSILMDENNDNSNRSQRNRKSPPPRKSKNLPVDEENDTILEPAPGVIFTMLNSTRAGPKKINVTNKQQIILDKSESFLHPVKQNMRNEKTTFSVEEILGAPTTNSYNLPNKLKPIPPIKSTPVN